jgi:uncharacterized repeat protein (TIGR01451 family)/fimbrial isopeptide formation D2 family protein
MGAGARKSLVLSWTALFLCSLLLQYMSLAAPASVLAVHDDGLFELDGNVENGAAAGDDWNAVFNDNDAAFETVFVNDPVNGNGDKYFDGGSTKDVTDITSWLWTTVSQPQDKNDIAHAYAAGYRDDGNLLVYFGLDRYASNGAAQVGFWFLKGGFGLTGGPATGAFSGQHQNGDVLVQIDFENGGADPVMRIYEWNNGLDLVETGGSCATTANGDARCAIAAEAATDPAWTFDDKFDAGASNDIPAGGMVEGGIDLTALGLDEGCFASFVAETRSSPSPDSTLSDFANGSFSLCSRPDIATQVELDGTSLGSLGVINKGETVTDHATLTGTSGTVTGTVDFYVCGPNANGAPDCTSGGTKVGATTTLSGGEADSDEFTPTQTGYYCFRVEYDPAAGSKYLAREHTNGTTECFRVVPATIDLTKTADAGSVSAGTQIGFTLTIASNGPGSAFGVQVSDTLPANAGLSWSIDAASTTGTWSISSGVLSFGGANGVTMAAGTSYHVHLVSPTSAATCGAVNNTGDATTSNDGTDSASASIQVLCPDVKVTKTPDGASINAGDTATFSIKVENVGQGTATGVTLTDDLPGGVHWTESEADCAISGPDGAQVLSCDVGTLALGASKTYTVGAVTSADNCGPIDNMASASATNEPSNVLGNNGDSGSINVLCAQIDITKTADDATVNAGDEIGFTITVANNGDGTAYDVSASDILNPAFSWSLAAPSAGWTLVGNQLSFTSASMAAGATSSVHVVATSAAVNCGVVNNTATVITGNDGSDEASASVTIQCPDVTVVKAAVASPVNAGDPIAFDITVSNSAAAGTGTAYEVTLSDPLPDGITWSEDSTACSISGTGDDQVLSCSWASLAPGESATVRVSGTTGSEVCGSVPNTATVAVANEPVGNQGNNSDDATVVVDCPDLQVVKSAVRTPISAGDEAVFTITVTNVGPGTAYEVTLHDVLPGSADWQTTTAGCSITNDVLDCAFDSLAAGAHLDIIVSGTTTAADCPSLHNVVTVGVSNESADAETQANNTDDADLAVLCPDIHVDKSADNSPISAGDMASFTITVSNDGAGNAYDVELHDALPDGGIAWTEDSASCEITGTGDDQSLDCDFGTLEPGESASVTVSGETTAANCGTIPNTARATASNESAEDASDNDDTASISVECADITLTKTPDDPSVNATDKIGFTITVSNSNAAGTGTAKGVTVNDTLPVNAGLGWSIDAANSDPGWSIVNGELRFGPADLAAGASVSVHIVSHTTPATCGTIHNEAAVTTTNDGSDSDVSDIEVLCPDVRIIKEADNSPILAGQAASYTITVWNAGDGTAYDVELTDSLPAGLAWTDNSELCEIAGGVLTCDFGDLDNGQQASVTVSAPTSVEDCGDLPNLATVEAANEAAPDTEDNEARATIIVQCAAIDLVKTAGAAADGDELVVEPGDVPFTYEVTNTGTAALENISLVDDNATPADSSDDIPVICLETTLAAGASMTCTALIPVGFGVRTNIAVVTATPVLDVEGEVSASDDAVVRVPQLVIEKSFTGNTNGETAEGKQALEGDILTYTLAYDLTDGPVTDGIITDVLPEGLVYLNLTATDNDEFSFVDYDEATRTLTWTAPIVSKDGTVTYQVAVEDGAAALEQPLENIVTIDAGETAPDDGTADVLVSKPEPEITPTPRITPPPTSTYDQGPESPADNGLLPLLVAIAGLMLVAGVLAPSPVRARRRNRRS